MSPVRPYLWCAVAVANTGQDFTGGSVRVPRTRSGAARHRAPRRLTWPAGKPATYQAPQNIQLTGNTSYC